MSALAGRTALVTGASKGIGFAISQKLAEAGANVVMVARTRRELQASARELDAGAFVADVADARSVRRLLGALAERAIRPEILVNNAGLFKIAQLLDTTPEDFESTLRTNVMAPFLLARALAPAMRGAGRGHIVTIGSIADRHAYAGNAAYAASKFGARAMHQVLREEMRGSGIRVSLVSPGPTDTPLWDPIEPDSKPGLTPRTSMLEPDAVGDAVLYVVTRPPEVNIDELRVSRS